MPIKVLHEAEGHVVTCETKMGEVYRGKLVEAEDNTLPRPHVLVKIGQLISICKTAISFGKQL